MRQHKKELVAVGRDRRAGRINGYRRRASAHFNIRDAAHRDIVIMIVTDDGVARFEIFDGYVATRCFDERAGSETFGKELCGEKAEEKGDERGEFLFHGGSFTKLNQFLYIFL